MRLFRFVLGIACCAVLLRAQLPQWEPFGEYKLPPEIKTPLWITFGPRESDPDSSSTAYILCGGVDANFNARQDSGDVPPALVMGWSEFGGMALLGLSLPWGPLSFPVRAAASLRSPEAPTFYVPRIDRLTRFSLPFGERLEDTLLPVGVQAVFRSGDTLVVSRRTGSETGEVWMLFPSGRVDTVRVSGCPNIQQVLWDARRQQLIVLCEGTFGGGNATVHFLPHADTARKASVPVGDTGNFLLLEGDTLVVVSNGSHELHLLDPATHLSYRSPLSTGTIGYGGPREALLLTLPNGQRTALVSTYSRDIRWIDLATGSVLQVLPLSGLAEGMALRRLRDTLELWVAQPFTPAYSPDSSIAIFRLALPPSVAEPTAGAPPRLTPAIIHEGPALVSWKIPEGAGTPVRAEVVSSDGRLWKSWEFSTREGELVAVLPLSRTELAAGTYFLRLSAGMSRAVIPFIVQ